MSEQHIYLTEGDSLVIHSVPKEKPGLEVLLAIGPVTIYYRDNYVSFTSDLDICNDGSGPQHGDQTWQAQTAYYSGSVTGAKYLNADKDKYMVVPPQIRSMVPGVVMGCKAKVTNLKTKVSYAAVVGDIGPNDITGEAAYCLAKILNPKITYNTGDDELIYAYELWPGTPATVDGFTYKLQPA